MSEDYDDYEEDEDYDEESPVLSDGLAHAFSGRESIEWRRKVLIERRNRKTPSAEPVDLFAPKTTWALHQRWEREETIIPMENEDQAREYLVAWTRWVKEHNPGCDDKLPRLLKSEVTWEVVE